MLDSLYVLNKNEASNPGQEISYTVNLNENHEVFKGHFPDQPVLPGVCQLAIVKDILERDLSTKLQLIQSKNVKFLKMIDPRNSKELTVNITIKDKQTDEFNINAVMESSDGVSLKFKGHYKIKP